MRAMRQRFMLLGVVTLGVSFLLITSIAGDAAISKYLQDGDAYRDAYLYSAAIDQYRRGLDEQPGNATLILRLCDVSLRHGDVAEAVAYSQIAGGQDEIGLAECRARIADAMQQPLQAVEQWSIVVNGRPHDRDAHIALIESQLAAHDWHGAIDAANHLLEEGIDDVSASYYLGALLVLEDSARATRYLADAATSESIKLSLALDEPLSIANQSYRGVTLGRVFLDHGRTTLAWRAFIEATTVNPSFSDAFAYLGITYDELGDETLALAYLDRALELASDSPVALYLRGVFLSRHGELLAAREDLERAAQYDPQNASIAAALSRVLLGLGEYGNALQQMAQAVEVEPDNPVWHLALAEMHIASLIDVEARGVPSARRAVALAPDDANAHDWLGWGLHLIGNHADAESELRTALALDATLTRARVHLGKLLLDTARIEEGRTELQRALDLDPRGEAGARARQLLGVAP